VLARPSFGEADVRAWAQSDKFGGSPGFPDGNSYDPLASVVINEYMAKTHWPGEEAIGKRITLDDSTWVTVIGVTKNTVRSSWAAPAEEEFFFPFYQSRYFTDDASHYSSLTLVARASCREHARCDASALAMPIVSQIRAIDRNIPISVVATMSSAVAGATAEARFYLVLFATFAAIALTLAAVGIYGVVSYSVSRRTHEIGIRIALGAEPSTVRWFIVRQGMSLSIIGGAAGLVVAYATTRLMSRLLYGVAPADPVTFVSVTVVLCGVGLMASYVPARRATRIDPLSALRSD
jgi:putative ABC transport system permease protein